jgi:hypothetical protein
MFNPSSPRTQLISTLSRIRLEWQDAVGSNSLIEVDGNMGMLLADLINGIDLGTTEQVQVLGTDLYQELKDFLHSPAHN